MAAVVGNPCYVICRHLVAQDPSGHMSPTREHAPVQHAPFQFNSADQHNSCAQPLAVDIYVATRVTSRPATAIKAGSANPVKVCELLGALRVTARQSHSQFQA